MRRRHAVLVLSWGFAPSRSAWQPRRRSTADDPACPARRVDRNGCPLRRGASSSMLATDIRGPVRPSLAADGMGLRNRLRAVMLAGIGSLAARRAGRLRCIRLQLRKRPPLPHCSAAVAHPLAPVVAGPPVAGTDCRRPAAVSADAGVTPSAADGGTQEKQGTTLSPVAMGPRHWAGSTVEPPRSRDWVPRPCPSSRSSSRRGHTDMRTPSHGLRQCATTSARLQPQSVQLVCCRGISTHRCLSTS